MTAGGGEPLRIFVSYAPQDSAFREELEKHLSPLVRAGLVALWSGHAIRPGGERERDIDARMEAADVVIILVSADFIASDYLHDGEMKRALKAHSEGRKRVIPILVRAVEWELSGLRGLEPLPRDRRPIKNGRDQDEAWAEVAAEVKRLTERPLAGSPVARKGEEPGARLWVHAWARQVYEGQPTVELNWTAGFDVRVRRVPPPGRWPALLAELEDASRIIAQQAGGSFVDVRGKMPLSVALAVGWAFPAVMFELRVEQWTKGRAVALWRSQAEATARRFMVTSEEVRADGEDLALALSVTADTRPALERFVAARGKRFKAIVIAEPDGGRGERAIGSEGDVVALAASGKQLLRDLRNEHGLPARTHLFLATPAGFAVFLGQALNAVGEVVSYEMAAGDTYQEGVTLRG